MVSFQKAQTGSRVYRGVGTSPNLGQVSAKGAQGYLKRELRKPQNGVRPVGKDGKSDSRSGVAARALRGGNISGNLGNNVGKTTGGPKNPPRQKGTKSSLNNPAAKGGGQPVGTAAVAPPTPQVRVTANGTLELPYSQNMSSAAIQALSDSNDELLSLQQEEQAMQQEAMQGRREADIAYKELSKQNLSANASGGTAFSSKYGKDVSDSATAYSNTLSDISQREADFNQQAALRRATIQSSLAQQLAAEAQEYQTELNDEAGNLGYGTYQGDTHTHDKDKKKRKPKPKKGTGVARGGKKR